MKLAGMQTARIARALSDLGPSAHETACRFLTALINADQREAVLLKVYQGFKFEEMAEILECPVSTVKSRLYTALDLLKATLAPMRKEVLRGES